MTDSPTGMPPQDTDDDETDFEPVDDEFDPFANRHVDAPPVEGEEGDDRVHEGHEDEN